MCGIVGYYGLRLLTDEAQAMLRRMCDTIIYRGPDDEGYCADDAVGLGMRRLSIIDLVHGHQPMSNEDGSLVIVFNGEIYNYRDLRADLISKGRRFITESDTESSCGNTNRMAQPVSGSSTACSPSPSGTAIAARFSWQGTGWASSLCTTAGTGRPCYSLRKSRRCWPPTLCRAG